MKYIFFSVSEIRKFGFFHMRMTIFETERVKPNWRRSNKEVVFPLLLRIGKKKKHR